MKITIEQKDGYQIKTTRGRIISCFDAKITAHRGADKYSVSFVSKVQRYWGHNEYFSEPGRAEAMQTAEKAMKDWEEKRWKEFDGELVNISEVTKVTVETIPFQAQIVMKRIVDDSFSGFTMRLEDPECPELPTV